MIRIVLASSLLVLAVQAIVLCAPSSSGQTTVVNLPQLASERIAVARPGDVVVLKDGVYEDARFVIKGEGTPGKPITFRAQSPGKARLTGDAHIDIMGQHVIVEGTLFDKALGDNIVAFSKATHCQLIACAFIGCGHPEKTYRHIITLAHNSQSNRIHHCYMEGNLSIGMAVRIRAGDYQNTYNRLDHNYFKDIERGSSNGREAIQIGQGGFSDRTSQYALVEHNLFDNASGDAEIISNKSCDNTYRSRNCQRLHRRLQQKRYLHADGLSTLWASKLLRGRPQHEHQLWPWSTDQSRRSDNLSFLALIGLSVVLRWPHWRFARDERNCVCSSFVTKPSPLASIRANTRRTPSGNSSCVSLPSPLRSFCWKNSSTEGRRLPVGAGFRFASGRCGSPTIACCISSRLHTGTSRPSCSSSVSNHI